MLNAAVAYEKKLKRLYYEKNYSLLQMRSF